MKARPTKRRSSSVAFPTVTWGRNTARGGSISGASGLVVGGGPEYYSFSINPAHARERFAEAHDIVLKACALEPEDRFASAGEMAGALRRVAAERPG